MARAKIHYDVRGVTSPEDAYARVTSALLRADPRHAGQDYVCPIHDDRRPSLGVALRDGHVLIHCSAGCDTAAVLGALGMTYADLGTGAVEGEGGGKNNGKVTAKVKREALPSEASIRKWVKNLATDRYWTSKRGISREVLERYEVGWNPEALAVDGSKRKGAYTFPYRDRVGNLIQLKRRWQSNAKHSKTFRLSGGYPTDFLWPEDQLDAERGWVLLCEGEPDVLKAISLGLPAVTGIAGAGGAAGAARAYAPQLSGYKVVVVFDASPVGRKAAAEVARTVRGYAESVSVWDVFPQRDDDSDLGDWFAFHGDDVDLLRKELRGLPELPLGEDINIPNRELFYINGKFNPVLLGRIAADVGQLQMAPGTGKGFWRYSKGKYVPDGDRWLKSYCHAALDIEFRKNKFTEVRESCDASLPRLPTVSSEEYINCLNGLLYWRETPPRLAAHSPDIPSVVQINARWDPKAECPNVVDFLTEAMPEDALSFVYEWIGYLLIPTTKYQRALMIEGPRDTGKSTFLHMIEVFLGRDSVSNASLQDVCDDKFTRAGLLGKAVNISGDLDTRTIRDVGVFKRMTAGDWVNAQKKFEDPFDFRPFARHMYSANELPGTTDHSGAFYKRWFVLPMHRQVTDSEMDPDLELRLATGEERSGLMRLAVAGLRRLDKRSHFRLPASMKSAGEQFREHTDPVLSWGKETLVIGFGKTCRLTDAYRSYTMWCEDNGRRPEGRNKFKRHVLDVFDELYEGGTGGYTVFRGATLR